MTIATGTVLAERWELTSRLASGGMGDVYRAQDRRGGGDVAVKVLRAGIVQGEERFAGEIEMLRRLDHPHVVAVIDAGQHDATPYLVMELLPGRSLSDLLRDGSLGIERVRRIGAAIAGALAYAHGRGIINRDVKPSNVLFADDETPKLADFGIAKLMDASGITLTGQAVGTAGYIAPEQLSAPEQVGPATDVYSLGLVLLEAATGQRAFVGSGSEAAMARLARDPGVPDDLPDTWRRLLRAMTARDPELRPPAEEIAELLEGNLPEEDVQTLVVPPARVDDATMPMAMAEQDGASEPAPPPGETQAMGKATHGLAASGAAAGAAGSQRHHAGTAASYGASYGAPTTVSRPAPSPPPPRKRSGVTPWILVVLLLLVVAAGAVLFTLGFGDDPADEPELDAPAELDDPPEDEPPPDEPEPEEPEPEEPAEEEKPPEEPEPGPEEPAEEPAPEEEEPGGGPPDGTPGNPQGLPDDGDEGAAEDDGADSSLSLDPTGGLDELEL